MLVALRPQAESQVERIQFQPVDEGKYRRRAVANESVSVNRDREGRQAHADGKRNATPPPRPQPFARDLQGASRFTARVSSWHEAGIVSESAAEGYSRNKKLSRTRPTSITSPSLSFVRP